MAPKAKITRKKAEEKQSIVINDIVIRAVDRTSKDIGKWRTAHQQAEQVVFANRTRLYDLYKDVELDGHLTGIIGKRNDAVLNKTMYYEVNGKKVDEMDDLIQSTVFRDIITMLMSSKYWGISGMEFIPGDTLHFEEIPRKHIKPDTGIIALEQNGQDGIPYNGVTNLWIVGKKDDLGLFLKCSPYALWKKGNMADWAQYIEIFGQPVRIIKYDAYDSKTKVELRQVLDEAGSSLAIMIPKQADFDMKDGKQSNGDGKLQESFKRSCDNEMSIIILGNTETTSNENGGSNAKAKEHGEQQDEGTKSDLVFISNYLSSKQFQEILKMYGYAVQEGGKFCYQKEVNVVALQSETEIDKFLVETVKLPLGHDYFYVKYGRPKPDNYDELVRKAEEAAAASSQEEHLPKLPGGKQKSAPEGNVADRVTKAWNLFKKTVADFFGPAR